MLSKMGCKFTDFDPPIAKSQREALLEPLQLLHFLRDLCRHAIKNWGADSQILIPRSQNPIEKHCGALAIAAFPLRREIRAQIPTPTKPEKACCNVSRLISRSKVKTIESVSAA